ncbi:MAG: hypothetical protein CFE35_16400 [Novosphingobium sp. PASSN1]|nr:MAG: hypothetical protein CFE35_16400 [Novosphingobium sp. PASSN1]
MRLLIGLLSCLLLAVPAAAAPGLWVIRDADTEVTIFGTVHALPANENWLTPRLTARLDAADTLVIETILPEDPQVMQALVTQLGMRPGLKPLAKRLPKADAAKLAPAVAAAGLPMPALDGMATWLAAVTISEAVLSRIGVTADSGVEPALTARARAQGKAIVGLETPAEQLRFLANLPEPDQVAMLAATITDVGEAGHEVEALLSAWRAGDVDRIAKDFDGESRASPLLKKVLLTDRNQRWADWISGTMKRPGTIFVAVGSGHLGGPDGLLAKLAAKGFQPQPIP